MKDAPSTMLDLDATKVAPASGWDAPRRRPWHVAVRGLAARLLGRDSFEPALGITPEDLARLRTHVGEALVRNARLFAVAIGLANLVFWPLDHVTLAGQPDAIRTLAEGRAIMSALCLLAWCGLAFLPGLRRQAPAALMVFTTFAAFVLGRTLAGLSGPSGAWFHYSYLLVLMPVVAWADLPQRVAATAAIGLAIVVGYFTGEPEYLLDPMVPVSLSHMAFAVLLSVVAGGVLDVLRREAYLMRLVVARQAEEVRALNRDLEEKVRAQTAELRLFAHRLVATREEERIAIARELHDELGQELTALRYAVDAARTRFEKDPRAAGPNLAQVEELVARTTTTTRDILQDLRPRVLDELGLAAALEWLVERTRARVACALELPASDPELAAEVASAAFRIAQEALTNVVKHARAASCRVVLGADREQLRLEVADDGCGFRPRSREETPHGMGLVGMRERALALGGTLEIASAPGDGTTVRAVFPLRPAAGLVAAP